MGALFVKSAVEAIWHRVVELKTVNKKRHQNTCRMGWYEMYDLEKLGDHIFLEHDVAIWRQIRKRADQTTNNSSNHLIVLLGQRRPLRAQLLLTFLVRFSRFPPWHVFSFQAPVSGPCPFELESNKLVICLATSASILRRNLSSENVSAVVWARRLRFWRFKKVPISPIIIFAIEGWSLEWPSAIL